MAPKARIVSRITVDGIHHWPDAPERVSFLRAPHRHLFYIEAVLPVTHDNRDVEFIEFGGQIRNYLFSQYAHDSNPNRSILQFGARSCEMLARELLVAFGLESCGVYEDNENGAEVQR